MWEGRRVTLISRIKAKRLFSFSSPSFRSSGHRVTRTSSWKEEGWREKKRTTNSSSSSIPGEITLTAGKTSVTLVR